MSKPSETFSRNERRNWWHSFLLIGSMVVLCSALGWLIAGLVGLIWLVAVAAFVMLIGPKVSRQWVLKMYRARRLSEQEAAVLIRIVRELAHKAGLSRIPELYYLPSHMINAFTVGTRETAAIGVTDGLLRSLNLRELTGVLAHELSHVAGNDGWVMGLADMMSQLVYYMSWAGWILLFVNLPLVLTGAYQIPWLFIILLILAPAVSIRLQLALSRTREYEADLDAVKLTGDPGGLAAGLAKLERLRRGSLFERIFFPGRRVPEPSDLRTHPSTDDRIKHLRELESALKDKPVEQDEALLTDIDWAPVHALRRPRWHISGFWY